MKKEWLPVCLLMLSLSGMPGLWGASDHEVLSVRVEAAEAAKEAQKQRVDSAREAYKSAEGRRDQAQSVFTAAKTEEEKVWARANQSLTQLEDDLKKLRAEEGALVTAVGSYSQASSLKVTKEEELSKKREEINGKKGPDGVVETMGAQAKLEQAQADQKAAKQELLWSAKLVAVANATKEEREREFKARGEELDLEEGKLQAVEGEYMRWKGLLDVALIPEPLPPKCTRTDPLPLVDWLLIRQMGNEMNVTLQSILRRDEYFNEIDSFGLGFLSVEPYGFYSGYALNEGTFRMRTFGVMLNGGVLLKDKWCVGVSGGYAHSNLDYAHFDGTNVNSFSLGPFGAYVTERGFVEMRLLGMYNVYDLREETSSGWDLDVHLGGGWDFPVPRFLGARSFLRPWVCLDYLFVFHEEHPAIHSVKVTRADFFSSCLAVEARKEFIFQGLGMLIPSVAAGWVLMQPVSQEAESYGHCIEASYPSSNQAYVEAKLTGVHKRGILLSLGFEGYLGSPYTVYAGTMNLEWSW